MKLEAIELYRRDLAFRRPVGTAAGVHLVRPVAFVRVVTDTGVGWGECPAIAGGTAVDPAFERVVAGISERGAERVCGVAGVRECALPPASSIGGLFGAASDSPVAATFEMAVLDAELRAGGEPLWRRLGADPAIAAAGVPVGHLVGIPEDRRVDTLLAEVATVAGASARVRLKIEPGWDVEPVRAVRAAFPGLALHADANGSYVIGSGALDDVGRLAALDGSDLTCVEQPLAPADLAALAAAARMLEVPVCLDESLTSLRRLEDAIRYGACEVACIKPGRFGGLLGAARAQERCVAAGIPAFVGGLFETGFARLAHAALAALDGFTVAGDLSDPSGYLSMDPAGYPAAENGLVTPYDEPGVAPPPDLGPPVRRWTPRGGTPGE